MCACDRRREQEAHRLDGLGVCEQAGAGAGRGPQSYNARESYRSQTRESTQTPFVTGLVTPVRLYDLRTWQATCQGWLRGWLAAHFGPLRQRWRLAVPEVDPKWTRNDTFRPTSGPAPLRPTSTHFGDIPRRVRLVWSQTIVNIYVSRKAQSKALHDAPAERVDPTMVELPLSQQHASLRAHPRAFGELRTARGGVSGQGG